MKRFNPLFSYLFWVAILVVSLVIDHRTAAPPVACAAPAADSESAAQDGVGRRVA